MGICGIELLELIIRPTLQSLGINSLAAERLLLGTAAVQSNLGFYIKSQTSNDTTGIGVYGIDKKRHQRVWDDYLAFDEDLASTVRGFASQHEFLKAPDAELAFNMRYSTAIAWMIYQQGGITTEKLRSVQDMAKSWYKIFINNSPRQNPTSFVVQYQKSFVNCTEQVA